MRNENHIKNTIQQYKQILIKKYKNNNEERIY